MSSAWPLSLFQSLDDLKVEQPSFRNRSLTLVVPFPVVICEKSLWTSVMSFRLPIGCRVLLVGAVEFLGPLRSALFTPLLDELALLASFECIYIRAPSKPST